MAVLTGRTVGKYVQFHLDDTGDTMREIPITAINGLGLSYEEVDVSAIQDAVKGFMNGQPDYSLEISGPLDTSAAAAASTGGVAPSLSGSHTILKNLPNDLTPLSFAIYVGMQGIWDTGDPVFGLARTTGAGGSGILCMNYNVDPIASSYTATFRCAPGSAAPAWGIDYIT